MKNKKIIIETILITVFILITVYYFISYSSFIILKNPKNEAVIYDRYPELLWKGNSDFYIVLLDDNINFDTPIVNVSVNSTNYKVNRRLEFGEYYFKIIDTKNNYEKLSKFTLQSLIAIELDDGIKNVGNTRIRAVDNILVTGAAVLEINQVLNKKLVNGTINFIQDE